MTMDKQICMGNTPRKRKHKAINIFSNFNISKETSNRKIGDHPNKSNELEKLRQQLFQTEVKH